MRLAFTYDLKSAWLARGLNAEAAAEFDSEVTVEAIATHFEARGFAVDRIGGAQELVARVAAGNRWDLAFNICEGLAGGARESLVPALFEHLGVPCVFSDAATLALCLRKDWCKQVVRGAGIATADFVVLDAPGPVALPFPVFAKPVAEGTGKGIGLASRCETPAALARTTAALLEKFRQPVLVETYLPGREFTVGIAGHGATAEPLGCMEVAAHGDAPLAYGYAEKADWRARIHYALADDATARAATDVALAAWRALGCRDGGRIDIRCDGVGRPHFIEVNPLAGLNPDESDLVIMAQLAGCSAGWVYDRIMDAALARLALAWPRRAAA
jgi:D-alanine-D-alanine ligase